MPSEYRSHRGRWSLRLRIEGKGAIAAHLARRDRERNRYGMQFAVRIAGSNAGHSAYDRSGQKWALRHVPVGAVADPQARLVIGPGSEIDPLVLLDEVERLESAGHRVRHRLSIDKQATIIDPRHLALESGPTTVDDLVQRIGSTGKGVGAARAARIMRRATLAKDEPMLSELRVVDTVSMLRWSLRAEHPYVLVEGTQGWALGLHAGWYPTCTSSDCRAMDFLAMAGLPYGLPGVTYETVVCLRVYPIRVAGRSGSMLGETSWEELGLPPEYTTVTKKRRRVGRWDADLARRAVEANGGPDNPSVVVALTMLDQKFPEVAGLSGVGSKHGPMMDGDAVLFIKQVEDEIGARVRYVGTSPTTIMELV
jgi:adenylosuccinate synthase